MRGGMQGRMQVCKGRDAGGDAGLHRLPGCSEDAALGRQARRAGGHKAGKWAAEAGDSQARAKRHLFCQGSVPADDFGCAGSPAQEDLGGLTKASEISGTPQPRGAQPSHRVCPAMQRRGGMFGGGCGWRAVGFAPVPGVPSPSAVAGEVLGVI